MTGPIQQKFKLIRDFMPVLVTCKFDKDWIQSNWKKMETPFSPFKVNGNAQERITPQWKVRLGPNLHSSEILCLSLLPANLTKVWLRWLRKCGDTVLSIVCQLELSVAMVTTVLIWSAPKPNAAFPPPKDVTDKTWLKLANWSWRYNCSKVWTTDDDNGWQSLRWAKKQKLKNSDSLKGWL